MSRPRPPLHTTYSRAPRSHGRDAPLEVTPRVLPPTFGLEQWGSAPRCSPSWHPPPRFWQWPPVAPGMLTMVGGAWQKWERGPFKMQHQVRTVRAALIGPFGTWGRGHDRWRWWGLSWTPVRRRSQLTAYFIKYVKQEIKSFSIHSLPWLYYITSSYFYFLFIFIAFGLQRF